MSVFVMTRFTFHEARRKKVLLGAVVLSLLLLAIYAVGVHYAFRDVYSRSEPFVGFYGWVAAQILMAALYVMSFIGSLLAIFLAVGTISSEIDAGTLHAIVPKPVHRWQIVMGKWMGFAALLTAYVWGMSLAISAVLYWVADYWPPHIFVGALLIMLQALLLLSVSMLGSTILPTVVNGILAFMLYAIAFAGGLIEQVGALIRSDTLVNIGIGTSLLMPSDALWRMAATRLQGNLEISGTLQGSPFSAFTQPSTAMAVYAVVYFLVILAAANWAFTQRDL